jgi:hypothetical protein
VVVARPTTYRYATRWRGSRNHAAVSPTQSWVDMATIKPIEGRSVHQIQSGQVIVDLQSVCKELVENSIDAGASSVGMHFFAACFHVRNTTDTHYRGSLQEPRS